MLLALESKVVGFSSSVAGHKMNGTQDHTHIGLGGEKKTSALCMGLFMTC